MSKNLLARHTVEWSREERRAVDSGREDRCNGRVPNLVVVKNQVTVWLGLTLLRSSRSTLLIFFSIDNSTKHPLMDEPSSNLSYHLKNSQTSKHRSSPSKPPSLRLEPAIHISRGAILLFPTSLQVQKTLSRSGMSLHFFFHQLSVGP